MRGVRDWLKERLAAEQVLIIGATLGAANELARSITQAKCASFGHHRLTLGQLAAALARPALAAQRMVPLSTLGVEAVTNRAVHKLSEVGALGRYAKLTNGPGFARAIANVITELRLEQIAPDAFAGVVSDLRPLLQAYEGELLGHGFTDWPGVLHFAAAAATDGGCKHQLVGLPTLLLDVPITTASDLALVRALCSRTPEMLVTVPANDAVTLASLRTGFGAEIVDLDSRPASRPAPQLERGGSLPRLQRHLFNDSSSAPEAQLDDQVVIFSAPGESRECVEIVRRVLALAHDGIGFDRMAVLLRSPQEYRSHLEEAFARAGVPVHFARGAVRPDPAGRAFHALLRCAAENLSAGRFAEYLSLSQVPDAKPDGTPPDPTPSSERWVAPDQDLIPRAVAEALSKRLCREKPAPFPLSPDKDPVIAGQLRAPRRWERLLVEAAVIGGRERWSKRIDGLAGELRNRLAEIDDEDEARGAVVRRHSRIWRRSQVMLCRLSKVWTHYQDPLIGASGSITSGRSQLAHCVSRSGCCPCFPSSRPMAAVRPVTLNDVLHVVSDLLLQVGVPPSAQRYGTVFVGPVEATRGMSFDAVFVPGLAERLFPRKIVEDPIMLDCLRAELNAGLTTNAQRLARERLALGLAVGAAERRLFLSYPRFDLEQARPRVPSFYALEALRAAEGRLPNFAELDRRAEAESSARIGWPAPIDPAEAIDHAEYDLAVLDRFLAAEPGQSRGTARYLLTTNSVFGPRAADPLAEVESTVDLGRWPN